jgi:predicted ABC-type ATPase
MSTAQPRLRVFAGPNGSGKSTLKNVLPEPLLGVYVNADDIEKTLREHGRLDLAAYGIDASAEALKGFLQRSSLLASQHLLQDTEKIALVGQAICLSDMRVNSYHASVLADFIRHQLRLRRVSFTFETVMSSADKVEFLSQAQQAGFRTYLYYIATEDPAINVSRVAHRVASGGHPVPRDKIISRYHRSLALLRHAIAYTDRAYLFDNSGDERIWLAEVTGGQVLEVKSDWLPHWLVAALSPGRSDTDELLKSLGM